MELTIVKDVFEFSKSAGPQSVFILMIFFQWWIIYKLILVNKEKEKILSDLSGLGVEQTIVMKNITDEIKEVSETINESTTRILGSVGKTSLPEEDVTYVAKRLVLSACIEKIKFLEEQLELDDIEHNQDDKKKHIKSHLMKLSRELYLDPLNKFTTKRGLVGDWIMRKFPFESFCEEIFRIFFDTKINRYKKRNLFLNIMTTYQNSMWEEFKFYLDYGEY